LEPFKPIAGHRPKTGLAFRQVGLANRDRFRLKSPLGRDLGTASTASRRRGRVPRQGTVNPLGDEWEQKNPFKGGGRKNRGRPRLGHKLGRFPGRQRLSKNYPKLGAAPRAGAARTLKEFHPPKAAICPKPLKPPAEEQPTPALNRETGQPLHDKNPREGRDGRRRPGPATPNPASGRRPQGPNRSPKVGPVDPKSPASADSTNPYRGRRDNPAPTPRPGPGTALAAGRGRGCERATASAGGPMAVGRGGGLMYAVVDGGHGGGRSTTHTKQRPEKHRRNGLELDEKVRLKFLAMEKGQPPSRTPHE